MKHPLSHAEIFVPDAEFLRLRLPHTPNARTAMQAAAGSQDESTVRSLGTDAAAALEAAQNAAADGTTADPAQTTTPDQSQTQAPAQTTTPDQSQAQTTPDQTQITPEQGATDQTAAPAQ